MHFIYANDINTVFSNNCNKDSTERHLLAKNDINKMKAFEFCICALGCITLTSSLAIISKLEEQSNNGMQFVNACAIEVGMAYEDGYDVRDIINDEIDKPELEEKTRKHGCIIECLLGKMNWMEGSELKEEKLYADINKVFTNHPSKIQIEEIIRNCAKKVQDTTQERCERGVVAMKCVLKGAYRLFPSAVLNEENEENEEEK